MDRAKVGMLAFVFAEANFFVALILGDLYFRTRGTAGPTAATALDPALTAVYSAFLLTSSVTVSRAVASARRGARGRLRLWLLATIALGAVFLVGQGREYARLVGNHVTIATNTFGSSFFTLTGLHGLHVLLGLIVLAVLTGLTLRDDFGPRAAGVVDAASVYWHFVDGVWIVIFTVVYIGGAML